MKIKAIINYCLNESTIRALVGTRADILNIIMPHSGMATRSSKIEIYLQADSFDIVKGIFSAYNPKIESADSFEPGGHALRTRIGYSFHPDPNYYDDKTNEIIHGVITSSEDRPSFYPGLREQLLAAAPKDPKDPNLLECYVSMTRTEYHPSCEIDIGHIIPWAKYVQSRFEPILAYKKTGADKVYYNIYTKKAVLALYNCTNNLRLEESNYNRGRTGPYDGDFPLSPTPA
jgi:hypothetical protein